MHQNKIFKIDIQLDKKAYEAGDQVNGSVKLDFKRKFPGNKVYLTIKGIESLSTNSSTISRNSYEPNSV